MKTPKLHQIIAIEKGIKNRVYSFASEVYKTFQKPSLFEGMHRAFTKKDEDGEDFPSESSRVQRSAKTLLNELADQMVELFDVTATKDWANCQAKTDLYVGDQLIAKGVPATYLLFLDKQLKDIRAEIVKLPELDPAVDWTLDQTSDLFKSSPAVTTRTKKVQRPIVLYGATDKHPAQTQLITDDVVIGSWTAVRQSGAIPGPRKKELLDRVEKLIQAVKFAREDANESDAPHVEVGRQIFNFLLS